MSADSDLLMVHADALSPVLESAVLALLASEIIARTGRSRNRFDIPDAAAISLRPMLVSWSTRLPNSGELTS